MRLEAGLDAELDRARARPPAEPVVHHQQAAPAQAPTDGSRRRQRALDARQGRQHARRYRPRAPPRRSRRGRPARTGEPRRSSHALDRVRVEVQERAPPVAVGRRSRDGELPADRLARVEQHDLSAAGERKRAFESGRSRPHDRDPPAGGLRGPTHDERRGRPAIGAGRPELGVDRAQEHRVEGAAILVAGDARPDVRRPPAEQLARHVGIGDQRARHADQVRPRGERCVDRLRGAEGVRDQQWAIDQLPEVPDVAEQRRLLGRHVAHVRRAHAHRQVHVVDQLAHVGEQRGQPLHGQARLLPTVGRQPDPDHELRSARADLPHDARDDREPAVERLGAGPAVRRRRQELREQVAVRGVQLDDLEPGLGGVERRAAEALDDRVELPGAQRPRPRRLARRAHRRRRHRVEPLLGAGRLAAEVHQLAGRHGALGADRLRPRGHPRHRLGAPRLGRDPAPPRGLRRDHRAADREHRRAAGRPPAPVLGVFGQRQPVLEDPAAVGRAHEPVAQREIPEIERLGGAHRHVRPEARGLRSARDIRRRPPSPRPTGSRARAG